MAPPAAEAASSRARTTWTTPALRDGRSVPRRLSVFSWQTSTRSVGTHRPGFASRTSEQATSGCAAFSLRGSRRGIAITSFDIRPQRSSVVELDLRAALPTQPFDVVFCLGLLEYIEPLGTFFARLASRYPALILSYTVFDAPEPLSRRERRRRGWLSNYTKAGLEQELDGGGANGSRHRVGQPAADVHLVHALAGASNPADLRPECGSRLRRATASRLGAQFAEKRCRKLRGDGRTGARRPPRATGRDPRPARSRALLRPRPHSERVAPRVHAVSGGRSCAPPGRVRQPVVAAEGGGRPSLGGIQ